MQNISKLIITMFVLHNFSISLLDAQTGKWEVVADMYILATENAYRPVAIFDIASPNGKDVIIAANVDFRTPYTMISHDSGKTYQYNLQTPLSLYSSRALALAYPDTTLAILVCDTGFYYRTTDNGKNWIQYQIDNKIRIFSVHFWDNKNGLISQNDGIIRRTTDGGETWFDFPPIPLIKNIGPSYTILLDNLSVYFIEAALQTDSSYYFHKTTDLGLTWTSYKSLDYPPGGNFYFINENVGFQYGGISRGQYMGSRKYIRKTTDGGRTWKFVMNHEVSPHDPVVSLHFADSLYGMATTLAYVYQTTDGGETWEWDPSFTTSEFKERISTVIMLDRNSAAALPMNTWRQIYRYSRFGTSDIEKINTKTENNVSIRPNPATEYITIQTSDVFNTSEVSNIKIYNILGQCVGEIPLNPPLSKWETRVDVTHLSQGVYFVRIGNITELFVKL